MEESTAQLLIYGVQIVGLGAAAAWKYAVSSAVRRFSADAKAHGYVVRSTSPQDAYVTIGDAEVGAVVEITIVKRRGRSGLRDVEKITRHWHAQLTLPEPLGSIRVARGAPGRYRRAPIHVGGGLTADVGDGGSAALLDETARAAIAALDADAKLHSLHVEGTMLHASWRRRSTSLRLAKSLGAGLEGVADALARAKARVGDVDPLALTPASSTTPDDGGLRGLVGISAENRELALMEPLLHAAVAAGHRLRDEDGDRGFVVVDGPDAPDVFVAAVVDKDTGRQRRGYRLGVAVDVDGSFDVGGGAIGYSAVERRLGPRLVASAHDAAGLDALGQAAVAAFVGLDAVARVISASLKKGRLTVFCARRGADLDEALRLVAAMKALVAALEADHRE